MLERGKVDLEKAMKVNTSEDTFQSPIREVAS